MLKDLSPEKKKKIAIFISGAFSLAVFTVWLLFVVGKTVPVKTEQANAGGADLGSLKNQIGEKWGEVKSTMSFIGEGLKNVYVEATTKTEESTTTESTADNSLINNQKNDINTGTTTENIQ